MVISPTSYILYFQLFFDMSLYYFKYIANLISNYVISFVFEFRGMKVILVTYSKNAILSDI